LNEPLKDPLKIPSPVSANEAVVASSACEAVACGLKVVARAATEAESAVLASLAKSAKLAVASGLNKVARAATEALSAVLASEARSAKDAVASADNVVALAATDAESIVPVDVKYPESLFNWDMSEPDTIIFFHSAILYVF